MFSAILVFFLIGLALGPLIVTIGTRRGIPTLPWLGATQLLIAVLAAIGTVLIAWRPFDLPAGTSWALVVIPTATAIGLSLPLSARLVPSDDVHVGRDAGLVLASNTTGVVLGTVAIPFLVMPILGSPLSVIALAAVNVILGMAILWLAGGRRLGRPRPRLRLWPGALWSRSRALAWLPTRPWCGSSRLAACLRRLRMRSPPCRRARSVRHRSCGWLAHP